MKLLDRISTNLSRQVDASSLAFLRIAFAALILWDVWRFITTGWIDQLFIEPVYHFKYFGFAWVQAWPDIGMYWHFIVIGIFALMMMLGIFYRLAAVGVFLTFSYLFLIDQTIYLNHFYLVILVNFLLMITPANRCWSVDAWRNKSTIVKTIPYWAVLLFVMQFEIVYLFAGIVKVNSDWLHGQPLTMWLQDSDMLPVIGWWFTLDWVPLAASYAVVLLHLIGAPLLLFKRTRLPTFIIYCIFHLTNAIVFNIGIFPWLTIAGTLMFFDPDWPKQVWQRCVGGDTIVTPKMTTTKSRTQYGLIFFIALWLAFQIGVPLRHYLYPGDVAWTEEGHRFAWRMKLRDKSGVTQIIVKDKKTGELWHVKMRDFIAAHQVHDVATRPDMLLQLAHFIGKRWREIGYPDVQVFIDARVSLNGRAHAPMIDPKRDMLTVKRELWPPADWILPLTQPLPEAEQRDD